MVKTWSVDDGLPESSISDVVQTSDGYLWVSTLNSGLSRFDGVRFVNFDLPFPSRFIGGARRLFTDDRGGLWINGFGNYLASFHAGTFVLESAPPVVIYSLVAQRNGRAVFSTKEGNLLEQTNGGGTNEWRIIPAPGAATYNRFAADGQGGIWYRRADGQLCRLTGDHNDVMPSLPHDVGVTALASDNLGTILVGSTDGLFAWINGSFQNVTPTNGETVITVRGLVSDGQGGWWVEANGRLRRCRERQWIADATDWREQKSNWSRVRFEQPDADGGVWLAYTDRGIIHINAAGKLALLTTADGLPSNRVRTMTQDREGNVWTSFERGGLACIRPRLFEAVGNHEGLADMVTTSVCEDAGGSIWIGTVSGVVSRWHDGVCTNFTLPLAGTHSEMSTVCPDASGRVWIGTHGNGLWAFETNQFRNVLSPSQIGMNIRGIFVSHDGRLWIASQDGLFSFADGQLQKIQTPKSEADYPTAVNEGAGGTIWVAMNTGTLLKISGDKQESFLPAAANLRVRFSDVCEDAHGTVWIGTFGAGLLHFRDNQFTAITKQDGLPTDNISQVMVDGAGGLWAGSPAGVVSLRKKLSAGKDDGWLCHVFGRDDGLPTVGCATASQPTAWRARDGRLWFAMADGVASIRPQDSETKPSPPLTVLEEVLVDGQPEALPKNGSVAVPLRLGPGRHRLQFRFTGLSFLAPERIRFKYILEGLDGDWLENRNERTVSYNSVPPGKYRFRVMACNGDGVWSEAKSSLALVLPPHIWEMQWFRASALAAVLLLVSGSVFWTLQLRHRRQLRALEQQQALERERTRIAQDIHDDLGASLTRITMLSQSALNKTQSALAYAGEVNRIYTTARGMTNAMDEIVWAINPRHDSLDSVAAYFAEFVEEFLQPTGLRFRIDFPLTLPAWTISAEVRHNLFLAFKEALNNVVKHARATELVVALEVRSSSFILTVQDDGGGFTSGVLAGISRAEPRAIGGNGLSNMRHRLEELGGRCTVESAPGRGTRVNFEVELRP